MARALPRIHPATTVTGPLCSNVQIRRSFRAFPHMRHASTFGLTLSATVVAFACAQSGASQASPAAASPQGASGIPVTAAPVVRKDMPLEVSVIGSVEAYSTVTVRAQVTGELEAVHFQQGDDVQEGQELFTLDRRPLEAALQ